MAESPRPIKRAKTLHSPSGDHEVPDISGSVIAIKVGGELRYVHENVITLSSQFFKRATKPEWRGNLDATTPIDLSDKEIATFDIYCRWLYSQKLVLGPRSNDSYNELVLLYAFGENIIDPTIQDTVMNAIIGTALDTKKLPGPSSIKLAYGWTPAGCPLRRLFVDFWVYKAKSKWDEVSSNITANTCIEFVDDLVPALLRHREKSKGALSWAVQREQYMQTIDSQDGISPDPSNEKSKTGIAENSPELEH